MSRCLICDKVIEDTFCGLVDCDCKVCNNCFDKFEIRNESFCIEGVQGVVLYYYNDFFKNVLYRYKGVGDYMLKDAFVFVNNRLNRMYKGYSIILAPSNKEIEEKRGYCHLEEIFKNLNLKIIKCFEKSEKWKQSDKKLSERKDIQKVIKIDKRPLEGIKKVLIVDDVLTSGSTIKAMISQLPSNIDKKVLVLYLHLF